MNMKPSHLASAMLVVYSILGANDYARATCTTEILNDSTRWLTLNDGDDVCATNSTSISATSFQDAVKVVGPLSGSATILLTNESDGTIAITDSMVRGIAVSNGSGLSTTIINKGSIAVDGTSTVSESEGINAVVTEQSPTDPLVIQNQGTINVTVAGSGSGIYFNHTVATIDNSGDISVTSGVSAPTEHGLFGIYAKSYDELTENSIITNSGSISLQAQSEGFLMAAINSIGGQVANTGQISVQAPAAYVAGGISLLNGYKLTNSGSIAVEVSDSGFAAVGIGVTTTTGRQAELINSGSVTIGKDTGQSSTIGSVIGINVGRAASVTNSGTVALTVRDGALIGIQQIENGSFNNSGTISAQTSGTSASNNSATGASFTISEGSALPIVNTGTIIASTAESSDKTDVATGIRVVAGSTNKTETADITTSGVIRVSGTEATGIAFDNRAALISNAGTIEVTGISKSTYGIINKTSVEGSPISNDSLIQNTGTMTVSSGSGPVGGISVGGGQIKNTGTISVQGASSLLAVGINFVGQLPVIENTNTINVEIGNAATEMHFGYGILASSSSNKMDGSSRISNAGSLSVTGLSTSQVGLMYGIQTLGGQVTNSGQVNTAVRNGYSVGLRNIVATGESGSIENAGTISAKLDFGLAVGIDFLGTGDVTNSGTIAIGGYTVEDPYLMLGTGIYLEGEGALTNTGAVIVTAGDGTVHGIQQRGFGSFNNSGDITASITNDGEANNIATGADIAISADGSLSVINTGNIIASTAGSSDNSDVATGILLAADSANKTEVADIQSAGLIRASGSKALGISFDNRVADIRNTGTIEVTSLAGNAYGITNDPVITSSQVSAGSVIVNSGTITVSGAGGVAGGIYVFGGSITNSGTIAVSGNVTDATAISSLYSEGISNSGTISATLQNGRAVGIFTQTNTLTNTGLITVSTSGSGTNNLARGVDWLSVSDGATVINTGTISATTATAVDGSDKAVAVRLAGDNVTFTNSGTLKAVGSTARAIEVAGTGVVVNINAGSVIVGDMVTDQSGNTLKFDLGAAQSYVYATEGDWNLQDMSGRPVVKGSAMAAGVGQAETADEMLFERTQLLVQSIGRGIYQRDAANQALWVDPYAYDSKRSASSSDPTVMKYGSNGFGLTLGYDFRMFGLEAQAIGNIQTGRLNIADNTQDIDSTSWLVGLRLPSFYEVGSVSFSAMAFAGRNQYSSEQKVLTNMTSTGTTSYSSDFGSTQLLFGLGAKYSTPIAQSTDLSLKADLYLSQEYVEGYQEGPYFSWNSRTLTQGSAFLEAGIDHRVTDQWLVQAKVGANAQTLFSGKDANYSINNTQVTFSGGQTNDTGLYAMLGTQYQVKDNARVGLSVWYGQTTNSVKTIQGMLEAKFLF